MSTVNTEGNKTKFCSLLQVKTQKYKYEFWQSEENKKKWLLDVEKLMFRQSLDKSYVYNLYDH